MRLKLDQNGRRVNPLRSAICTYRFHALIIRRSYMNNWQTEKVNDLSAYPGSDPK